ncbi:hypothetical protein BJ741DRAFT_632874 [Chytriomyces cf. hyalinus JEL632]|nr:hypothetical protein BJ741DRAFT_632874 [Chytriomyces cf. hyalinus JEL632]
MSTSQPVLRYSRQHAGETNWSFVDSAPGTETELGVRVGGGRISVTAGTRVVENVSVGVAYLSVVKKDATVGVKYLSQQKKATPSNKAKIKSAPKNRFQLLFETDQVATLFVAELSALGVRTRIVATEIPDTQGLAETVREVQETMMDDSQVPLDDSQVLMDDSQVIMDDSQGLMDNSQVIIGERAAHATRLFVEASLSNPPSNSSKSAAGQNSIPQESLSLTSSLNQSQSGHIASGQSIRSLPETPQALLRDSNSQPHSLPPQGSIPVTDSDVPEEKPIARKFSQLLASERHAAVRAAMRDPEFLEIFHAARGLIVERLILA